MATGRHNDLSAFESFIDQKLSDGELKLTLDDALGLWDYENQDEEEREDTLRAIRQGLADLDAGRVRPAEEVPDELRRELK